MKIVALEEHCATANLIAAWESAGPATGDIGATKAASPPARQLLLDLADQRIARMDAAGVDTQVLSVTTPGTQILEAADAVTLAREANDVMAETVSAQPDRFEGFATLPTCAPVDAARELERAVTELGLKGAMLFGRTGEHNLDHPDFLPILEVAAALRAPLYVHPQTPALPVRRAYYDGFNEDLNALFVTAGIGWHYETGVQVLRLILSGVFDRLPDLQLILGHWGEIVTFYLDRIDLMSVPAGLSCNISDYFTRNIYLTPSGLFSQRYLRWAVELVGAERIMLATDYPFLECPDGAARGFLQKSDLSHADRDKIASGNWEQLSAGIRRV